MPEHSSNPWSSAAAVPTDTPLAVLHSAGAGPWSTASLCAAAEGLLRIQAGGASWLADQPHPAGPPPSDPLDALQWAHDVRVHGMTDLATPCAGAWIMVLYYELGRVLEPAASSNPLPPDTPLADLLWCPTVHTGDAGDSPPCHLHAEGPIHSMPDEATHAAHVQRTVDWIHAGDIFQANIARQLTVAVHGDAMAWARHAIASNHAAFGALIRLPGRLIMSMSPELFLHVDAAGTITSRPIKGTADAQTPVTALRASTKDAAELHMIVDLVRNDLGRVCRRGTVRVVQARAMETHATVHHGVAQVQGAMRSDASFVDLLRATFPPGSVTGAPKIRAMQIIETLESRPRGAYCGALGMLGPSGDLMLSVGIRTATMEGAFDGNVFSGTLHYGTGGGITTRSDPAAELQETIVKARALCDVLRPSDAAADQAGPARHESTASTPCGGAADSP